LMPAMDQQWCYEAILEVRQQHHWGRRTNYIYICIVDLGGVRYSSLRKRKVVPIANARFHTVSNAWSTALMASKTWRWNEIPFDGEWKVAKLFGSLTWLASMGAPCRNNVYTHLCECRVLELGINTYQDITGSLTSVQSLTDAMMQITETKSFVIGMKTDFSDSGLMPSWRNRP
jgi:hypothetical protein